MSSSWGRHLEPGEVTEDMLPEVGSQWLDTMNWHAVRTVTVRKVVKTNLPIHQGTVWRIYCQEDQGWNRVFHMYCHGFLSRYDPVTKVD